MRIDIHDVDHGGCAVVTSPSGERLMLDCGVSSTRPWSPSVHYLGQRINTLMLLNLDEDHAEDMVGLGLLCRIGAFVSNPTVSAGALRLMKPSGMLQGVRTAYDLLSEFGPGLHGDWPNPLGGVRWHAFWNRYGVDFTDTNNLSLAVFVSFNGFTILFGGDLETAGWRRLLRIPGFKERLREVSVFVASHHGRQNGQCNEIFEFCTPYLTIFSDGPKQYETQETIDWYSYRTVGIPDWSRSAGLCGQPMRRVMTTRSDGTIKIDVRADGKWWVTSEPRPTRTVNSLLSAIPLSPILLGS